MTKIPQIKESYLNDPIRRKHLEEAVEELISKMEEVEQPNFPRILRTAISATQERKKQMENNNRAFRTERAHRQSTISDWITQDHSSSNAKGSMVYFNRPERRLLSHTNSQNILKIYESSSTRESTTIPSTSYGVEPICKDFYQNNSTSSQISQSKGNTSTFIDRRLVTEKQGSSTITPTDTLCTTIMCLFGTISQHDQIRNKPMTSEEICRNHFRLETGPSNSSTKQVNRA